MLFFSKTEDMEEISKIINNDKKIKNKKKLRERELISIYWALVSHMEIKLNVCYFTSLKTGKNKPMSCFV